MPSRLAQARVLVVDDELSVLDLVRRALLRQGAVVHCAPDATQAFEAFGPGRFDCVVSDIRMPGPSGLDLLQRVREQDRNVGFVLMTAAGQVSDARRAMRAGCDDFLMKPLALDELYLAVELATERQRQRHTAFRDREHFQNLAAERTVKLHGALERLDEALASERSAHRQTILVLAQAAENSARDVGKHIHRVAAYSSLLARYVGIEETRAEDLGLSSTLHDVGKLAVPAELLTREGPLSPAEYAEVQKHTLAGGRILEGIDFLRQARDIALAHHERWDGGGYPYGLAGEHIPLAARITALADVWDALTSRRCYKQAWPIDRVLDHVRRERGRHFDPVLVDGCLALQREFEDIRLSLSDEPPAPAPRHDVLRPFRPATAVDGRRRENLPSPGLPLN